MSFQIFYVSYNGLNKTVLETGEDWEQVKQKLHNYFRTNKDAVRYEETRQANGCETVAVKDTHNKIIRQYKLCPSADTAE